ncbi:MAG: tetratricopeptide repeat protein [Armatimonadota bacterium]|nr:tetratricopeptide repeat protein [bacterium]
MRNYLILALLACAVILRGPAVAEEKARPVVLLFQAEKTQDFDASFATSTTRALREYFRETRRVDAMIFDSESPTVERAILDKRLNAENVTSFSTREQRIEAAKVLGFQYVAGADISFVTAKDYTGKAFRLKIWLVDVDADQKGVWEATGTSVYAGEDDLALNNAMQSAASKAVIDVTREAFAKLSVVESAEPVSDAESTAIGSAIVPDTVMQADSVDYVAQAEESISAGNLAVAIMKYSRAVDADPTNTSLRIKLAEVYARKGMFGEAFETLDRALQAGAGKNEIDIARQEIQRIIDGQAVSVAEAGSEDSKSEDSAPEPVSERVEYKDAGSAAVAKLIEGDKLWSKGDPDEAAKIYLEAIRLNPADWRAHERLAIVDASMSLYSESRKVIEQLKIVQPNPPAATVQKRYDILCRVFDKSFSSLLEQYESDTNNLAAGKITRESYYSTINGLALRSESMAKFLDSLTVPVSKQSASLHRSLACGLFAQASSSMLEYLETNSSGSKANAQTFVSEARKELDAATRVSSAETIMATEKQAQPEAEPEYDEEPQPEPNAESEDSADAE